MSEEDPRVTRAGNQLLARIRRFVGVPLTARLLKDVDRLVKDHAQTCRWRGIDFPQVTAFFLPHRGVLVLYRKDLAHAEIQRVVADVIRQVPEVTPDELVDAVLRAWPDYRGATFSMEK